MIVGGGGGGGGELIASLEFDFYTDSIGHKSVEMLNSEPANGCENQNQDQFRVGNTASHNSKYPFIQEFSEFLASVSTTSLKNTLMTYQQRLMARSLWEATNYGGSKEKCQKHLEEIYGPQWSRVTRIEEHMEEERAYCEYVLILDHIRQWDKHQKLAKICEKPPN